MAIELSLQLTNNRPEIRNLRNRFDIFAQDNELPDKVIHDVQLALDEVVTNIVEYGYDDDDKHLIDIKFILNEQSLEIIIIDDANRTISLIRKTLRLLSLWRINPLADSAYTW